MSIYEEVIPYILTWYDYNARILPWRQEPTPYHVWLSEIMLQQTRVEAVKEYYDRFLAALPTIEDLANVDDEKLMKLWQGLGYYSRARNLKKAAGVITENYGGELPRELSDLRSLPGIGAYTAGAIGSIAYGIPEPAVDGNLLRVFARITGNEEDISKETTKTVLAEKLRETMPKDRPGDYNQALMDLGATVCLPNGEPHCKDCPVMHLCRAFHEDRVKELPVKAAQKGRREEQYTVFLVCCDGEYLIEKRPEKGLLAGLWGFPMTEGKLSGKKAGEVAAERFGITVKKTGRPILAKHIFSHVEWEMKGIRIEAMRGSKMLSEEYRFVSAKELEEVYSVPTAYRAFVPKEGIEQ